MLAELNAIRLSIVGFLNIIILENNFIIINFWSIVHLIVGGIVMLIIFKSFKKTERKLLILFILLIIWEIFEMSFWITGSKLFLREPAVDIAWDLIIGFAGGFIIFKSNGKK